MVRAVRLVQASWVLSLALALGLGGCSKGPVAPLVRSQTVVRLAADEGRPVLQGISFDGHLAEAFVGESMRPMTFEPVVVGADPARLVYAWDSEASFVGWSNQRLFHFWPTAPGRYRVMCVAATRDGREVGRRAVTIDVRPAPRPPL